MFISSWFQFFFCGSSYFRFPLTMIPIFLVLEKRKWNYKKKKTTTGPFYDEACDNLNKNCRHPAVTFERISFAHMRGTSATKQAVKISCNSTCNIHIQDIDHEPSNDDGLSQSSCWEALWFQSILRIRVKHIPFLLSLRWQTLLGTVRSVWDHICIIHLKPCFHIHNVIIKLWSSPPATVIRFRKHSVKASD